MEQPTTPTQSETDKSLTILARRLAQNYLDTSVSANSLPNSAMRQDAARQVFTEEFLESGALEAPCRNVLVVGAGASSASFGVEAFPTTDLAVGRLNAALEKSVGDLPAWLQARIKSEKDRLQLAYGYIEAHRDFETHLALLSRTYPPQKVANALSELYGERFWPHLTFEIIAHLLKHRFIDVVVNFNFDELLDQAIEEEVGRSQYHYVISDGQCRTVEKFVVDDRLKVPIHIKPHGTASHASTLRFTKEHYFALPDAMRSFLHNIVSGRTRDDGTGTRYRTNIISVGYGMKSIDFYKMLQETAQADDRVPGDHLAIYHLNTEGWYGGAQDWLTGIGDSQQHLIDVRRFGTLQGTLLELWDRISNCFNDQFRPRGIARHRIVHTLFVDEERHCRIPEGGGTDDDAKWQRDARYYFARLCTELVIALARANGRVDLETMVNQRVGMYFDKLREVSDNARKKRDALETSGGEVSETLRELSATEYSIQDVAERFGLAFGGYESTLLIAEFHQKTDLAVAEWLWETLRRVLESACGDLDAHLSRIANDPEKNSLLVDCLKRLVMSDTYDISANFAHRHLLLFNEPNPDEVLHTGLSMTLKFAEIIKLDWDLMLAVSEYGKILHKYFTHRDSSAPTHRRCCLIVADSDRHAEMEKRLQPYRDYLIGGIGDEAWYQLPYWRHNHHMLLLLKKGGAVGRWRRVAGLSYEKSGLSNTVNPIFFHGEDLTDLERLENVFFGYVFEAENPGWWYTRPSGTDRYTTKPQLARAKAEDRARELLKAWWNRIGR